MTKKNSLSRRKFISNAAVIGAAGTFGAKNFVSLFVTNEDNFGNKIDPDSSLISGLAPTDTYWFIPAAHWEEADFTNRSTYLDVGVPSILPALKLLIDYTEYGSHIYL